MFKSIKRKRFDSSSGSDADGEMAYDDSRDSSFFEKDKIMEESELQVTDFVIIKYVLKKSMKHYVGEIENIENDRIRVNFLKFENVKFLFPETKDEDIVRKEEECSL